MRLCSTTLHNMPQIEIIGIYPVQADEPVHLVELIVRGSEGTFEIGDITQEVPGQSPDDWQVPCMEHLLNSSGDEILADDCQMTELPDLWLGDVRLVFFFHYLDASRPLQTPFGEVRLPAESDLPDRLSMIEYDLP
jgi:hypothetical protein